MKFLLFPMWFWIPTQILTCLSPSTRCFNSSLNPLKARHTTLYTRVVRCPGRFRHKLIKISQSAAGIAYKHFLSTHQQMPAQRKKSAGLTVERFLTGLGRTYRAKNCSVARAKKNTIKSLLLASATNVYPSTDSVIYLNLWLWLQIAREVPKGEEAFTADTMSSI